MCEPPCRCGLHLFECLCISLIIPVLTMSVICLWKVMCELMFFSMQWLFPLWYIFVYILLCFIFIQRFLWHPYLASIDIPQYHTVRDKPANQKNNYIIRRKLYSCDRQRQTDARHRHHKGRRRGVWEEVRRGRGAGEEGRGSGGGGKSEEGRGRGVRGRGQGGKKRGG